MTIVAVHFVHQYQTLVELREAGQIKQNFRLLLLHLLLLLIRKKKVKLLKLTYTNFDTGEKKDVTELDAEFKEAEKGLEPFHWILDPEPMKKQIAIALQRHEEQKARAKNRYKPILFIVTMSIAEGERAKKMLEERFKIKIEFWVCLLQNLNKIY